MFEQCQQLIRKLLDETRCVLPALTFLSCDAMMGLSLKLPPHFTISRKWEVWLRNNSRCLGSNCPYPIPSSLGRRFFTSSWAQNLPEQLMSSILIFKNLVACHERMVELDSRDMPAENDCLLFMVHQLYSLPYEVATTPLQDVICTSLHVYSVIRIWGWQKKPCLEDVAAVFRGRIERCYSTLQQTASDLLFWSLFLGGLVVSTLVTKNPELHDWFLVRLKEEVASLGIRGWNEAVAVLEGFLFVRRPRDEPANELWRSITSFKGARKGHVF